MPLNAMQCYSMGPLIDTDTHSAGRSVCIAVWNRVWILSDFSVNEFKPINGHNSAIVWPNEAKLKKINKHNRANNKSKKLNF